ncbi:mevalonate kinase [Silvanigrella aquatica]|uniref:mevalonate kinase n=1 Tax=Silvanigrella aquatica TaxID=1915309 RepID=A0A1L4CYQ6_9BACT|nr:mevalonate kinase [Silvanigrella aquatica]APJ03089.1 mevalonate kinase [Silvanigrella aquatica]
MDYLSNSLLKASAAGKAILIGEHSVVYGYKAIAMALPDVRLQISLLPPDASKHMTSWDEAWQTLIKGQIIEPGQNITALLNKAFHKALSLCGLDNDMQFYKPQSILVESEIPLGGGMGSSAAISTCFVKIAEQIALQKNKINKKLTIEQQIEFANEIDCYFHFGKASGLDVAAVASDGIIEFIKGAPLKYLKNKKEFWLALIDTKERGETATMVAGVAKKIQTHPLETKKCLEILGILAEDAVTHITDGNVIELSQCLNTAQIQLNQLGVSTPNIEEIILKLKSQGALAAKLTGAGGGGLVLGLFANEPNQLYHEFDKDSLFITRVPAHGTE